MKVEKWENQEKKKNENWIKKKRERGNNDLIQTECDTDPTAKRLVRAYYLTPMCNNGLCGATIRNTMCAMYALHKQQNRTFSEAKEKKTPPSI